MVVVVTWAFSENAAARNKAGMNVTHRKIFDGTDGRNMDLSINMKFP